MYDGLNLREWHRKVISRVLLSTVFASPASVILDACLGRKQQSQLRG
jgi:hypothetical protein